MKKYIGHIPLIIIVVVMSYCIYEVNTTYFAFSYKHYVGLSLILIALLLLVVNPAAAKIVTGITLLLGTFTIVAFTAIVEYYRIGFSIEGRGLDIKIQIYCLLLLLLHVLLNLNFLKSIFRRTQKKKTIVSDRPEE